MKKILTLAALLVLATACGTKSATPATSDGDTSGTVALTPIQISEFGVEFTPVKSISDIRYTIDPLHSDTADFSSASLTSLDQSTGGSKCTALNAPLGTLSRVVDFSAFTASGHTPPANVKIGDYYYYYTHPQSTCSANQAVQNLETLQSSDFGSVMGTLQAIPAAK